MWGPWIFWLTKTTFVIAKPRVTESRCWLAQSPSSPLFSLKWWNSSWLDDFHKFLLFSMCVCVWMLLISKLLVWKSFNLDPKFTLTWFAFLCCCCNTIRRFSHIHQEKKDYWEHLMFLFCVKMQNSLSRWPEGSLLQRAHSSLSYALGVPQIKPPYVQRVHFSFPCSCTPSADPGDLLKRNAGARDKQSTGGKQLYGKKMNPLIPDGGYLKFRGQKRKKQW